MSTPNGRTPGDVRSQDDRELDTRIKAYLRDAPSRAPEHLLPAATVRVHATPQRRGWRTSSWSMRLAPIAAVVALAVIASVQLNSSPDTGVPPSMLPSASLVEVGDGREAVVLGRAATSTTVRTLVEIDGRIWAVLVDGLVLEIDPATGAVLVDIDAQLDEPTAVAAGPSSIWIGSLDGDLVRVDASAGAVNGDVAVGIPHHAVAASDDAVWVAGASEARRIDAMTLAVANFELPPGVVTLAAVGDDVWATYASGEIVVADGETGQIRARLSTGAAPGAEPGGSMAVGAGQIWVADPASGQRVHRITVDGPVVSGIVGFDPPQRVSSIAADRDGAWLLFEAEGRVARLDGTLRVTDVIDVGIGARGVSVVAGRLALWGAGGVRFLEAAS